jgi:hypothetical protein
MLLTSFFSLKKNYHNESSNEKQRIRFGIPQRPKW